MSLTAALQIGRSGLLAQQAAIEVTGNNLSNLSTPGYHRQQAVLSPAGSQEIQRGIFLGRGVQIEQVRRAVDSALDGRVRASIADEAGSTVRQQLLSQIESLQNETSDSDLSSQLSALFNAFSELSNQPGDVSLRSLAIQQAQSVTSFVRELRADLVTLRAQTDQQITQAGQSVNALLGNLEALNQQISLTERGQGSTTSGAGGLRDQRDQVLADLSQYLDISVSELPSGAVDVFVGSIPIVLNGKSRGVEVRTQTVDGELEISAVLKDDGTPLDSGAGKLAALVQGRDEYVGHAIEQLDTFSGQLIYQVNRLHSQGQAATSSTTFTSEHAVLDAAATLNTEAAGLPFTVSHGSFQLHVTQASTGQRVTSTIAVDLDGLGADTTLSSLAAAINAVTGVSASVTPEGRLRITSDSSDLKLSFSDDSSGTLAALGINTLFSGTDATDIAVSQRIAGDPKLLAIGLGHVPGDNRNALAIASLRSTPLADLGGASLSEYWNRQVEDLGVKLAHATQQQQSSEVVRQSLEAQQQQVSGVNSDEEAINLLSYQRAYQGSARFLTVVDDLMQTLLNLV